MRVVPLGFAYRNAPVDVLKSALLPTLIPKHHTHPWSIEGTLAQVLAVAHLSKLQPPVLPAGPPQQQRTASRITRSSAVRGQACNAVQLEAVQDGAVQAGRAVPAGALEFLRVLQQQLQGHSYVMCARLRAMEQGLEKVSQFHQRGWRSPSLSLK
jgi:hypothetical protein